MRDIKRLNAEVQLLHQVFGEDRVYWAPDYRWIYIAGFSLPPNVHPRETEVLILVPDNYGYGQPYRDLFVGPGLKVQHKGQWKELPHYFDRFPYRRLSETEVSQFVQKGWSYLCLHQAKWDSKSNVLIFLDQVRVFLGDPFRNWDRG